MTVNTFTTVVLEFFIYAMVGWIWETSLAAVKRHKFVDTGFLIGPITPIYGFGVLGVIYLLEPWRNQLGLLFIFATILVSLLEYVTGFLLEKLFHTKWWNYEKVPLNIQGRVALPVSLFWGVCCVLIIRFVQPEVVQLVNWLRRFGLLLPVGLIALGSFDFGFTLANLQSFRQKLEKLELAVEERRTQLNADVTSLRTDVQENWDEFLERHPQNQARLSNLNFGQRHLLRSFPNLRTDNDKVSTHLDDIRELVVALRNKTKRDKKKH